MNKDQARVYIGSLPYVAARDQWCCRGDRTDWIVLHSVEGPETPLLAENVASYFANPGNRTASTQFVCDSNSTVRCAGLDMIVAGARGANHTGIHIEQAGYAAQDAAAWRDYYSSTMIRTQVAPLVAALCVLYDIPAAYVDAAGVAAGDRGITTHADVWRVHGGDYRYDPGAEYPMDMLLDEVRIVLGTQPRPPEDDDVTTLPEIQQEFTNQDTRQRAYLEAFRKALLEEIRVEFSNQDARTRAYLDARFAELEK